MIMMGDRKKQAIAILGPHSAGVGKKGEEDQGMDPLHAISEELVDAVHSKDHAGVASALRAAFDHLDAEPHVEGPHEG